MSSEENLKIDVDELFESENDIEETPPSPPPPKIKKERKKRKPLSVEQKEALLISLQKARLKSAENRTKRKLVTELRKQKKIDDDKKIMNDIDKELDDNKEIVDIIKKERKPNTNNATNTRLELLENQLKLLTNENKKLKTIKEEPVLKPVVVEPDIKPIVTKPIAKPAAKPVAKPIVKQVRVHTTYRTNPLDELLRNL